MHDLHNHVSLKRVVDSAAIGANATKSGRVIDRQNFGGVEFILNYGAVTTTGSIVTVVCKEGDVTGTLASVADGDMIGTEVLASLLAATPRASDTTKLVWKRLGYKGRKRYVTVDLVQTGVTSVGLVSVVAALHSPRVAPTDNPG
jgi:hypothetical protein